MISVGHRMLSMTVSSWRWALGARNI